MIPVVPTGCCAIGVQVYIAPVELPQQRSIATKYQAVDIQVFSGYRHIAVGIGHGYLMGT